MDSQRSVADQRMTRPAQPSPPYPAGIISTLALLAVFVIGGCQAGTLSGQSSTIPAGTNPDNELGNDAPGTPNKAEVAPSGSKASAGLNPGSASSDRSALTSDSTDPYPDHYREPGAVFGRSYSLDPLRTEFIDNYAGRVRLQYTDLKLPGRGPTIEVIRTYHNPTNPEGYVNRPILRGRSANGIGWDIHFGRIHWTQVFTPMCKSGNQKADKNPILELPDGSRKVLFDADEGAPYHFITKDRWTATCVSGHHVVGTKEYTDGGLLVRSPDGTQYTMDWKGRVDLADTHMTWSVTKIEDRHGNTLTFSYLDRETHTFTLIDTIVASDQRVVRFSYDGGLSGGPKSLTPLPTEISAGDGSHVWRYSYQASVVPERFHLKAVTGPDGLAWRYTYHTPGEPGGANGHSIDQVINPFGGTTRYEFQQIDIQPHTTVLSVQGIKSKTISGPGVEQAVWTYSFFRLPPNASPMDFTEVVGPTTRVLYEHCGLREVMSTGNCAGQQGQLLSKEIYKKTTDGDYSEALPVQRETYVWGLLPVAAQDEPINGVGINDSIEAAFQTLLTQKTIYRDGEYYTTSYYGEDDYGNPRAKIEYRSSSPPPRACFGDDVLCLPANNDCDHCSVARGPKRRDSELSYHIDVSRWIINQLKDETLHDFCIPLAQESPSPAFCGSSNTFESGTVRVFDNKSNLKETHSRGHTDKTVMTYHDHGGLHTKTDPRGHTTTFDNYYRGIPQLETHPEGVTISRVVDPYGNIQSQADGEKKTSSYTYDGLHRLRSIATPRTDDADITVNWDWRDGSASNFATRTVARGGSVDKRVYDGFGREVKRIADTITLTTTYDPEGRKIFSSYPNSTEGVRYEYDTLGRPLKEIKTVDGAARIYDYKNHNVRAVTDELGRKTVYHYRAFGDPDQKDLVKVIAADLVETEISRHQSGAIYRIKQGERYRYYMRDSRYRIRYEAHQETGAHFKTWDDNGNLLETWVDGGFGRAGGTVSGKTSRHYDGLNRLKSVSYPAGTDGASYTYNKNNKPKTATRGPTQWVYSYDDNGNLKSETLEALKRKFAISYTYDARDAVKTITYPSGLVVDSAPDLLGRPTKAAPFVTDISYYPNGDVRTIAHENGHTTTHGQDKHLRLDSIATPGVVNLSYGYDAVGNVTSIVDKLDGDNTRSMTYDDTNRLKTANGAWDVGSIVYNDYGDIKKKTMGAFTLDYIYGGTEGKGSKLSMVAGSTNISFAYDVYGNVSRRGAAYYRYNDASELASFKPDVDAPSTDYIYDANGRRVAKKAPSGQVEISVYSRTGQLLYSDADCALTRTDHIRVGRVRVASRKQTCSGDTDRDGIPDCDELCGGLDPNDEKDAQIDSDGDGLKNIDEYKANTLFLYADSDDDGLLDKVELDGGTDPRDADTDNDGLDDGKEVARGTDPHAIDSDGDGMTDGFEVDFGLDPKTSDTDTDTDDDGFSDLIESLHGSDPTDKNSKPTLATPSTLLWSYDTASTSESEASRAPLLSAGGNIVAFGSMHILDWKGGKRRVDANERAPGGIISEGGAIVGLSGKAIRAWQLSDGAKPWTFGSSDIWHWVLARGPKHTIYVRSSDVGGHRVRAIDSRTGEQKWVSDPLTAVWSSGAVASDGTIYVIDSVTLADPALTALSPQNGAVLWTYRPGGDLDGPLALGVDGSIYLRGSGNTLHAVNADGTKQWVTDGPGGLESAPVVGTDGKIYLGGYNAVYAFQPDGTSGWTHDVRYDGVMSGTAKYLAVARDGAVYYTLAGRRDTNNKVRRGWVRALDPETGTHSWGKELSSEAHGFAVGEDGTLIVATYSCHPKTSGSCTREAKIRAVAGNLGGLSTSAWPITGHDNQNSNHLPACPLLDSDGDTIPDCVEARAGLNPRKFADGEEDADGDGLTNAQEFQLKTHYRNADSDGDGLKDGVEVDLGLNPKSADSDGDGMRDGYEVRHNLKPRFKDDNVDEDRDGFTNLQEHDGGSSASDRWSVPAGNAIWSYDAGAASKVAPVMGQEQWVYFAAGSRVYRFKAITPYQTPVVFHTADATVRHLMFGRGRLFVVSKDSMVALNASGGEEWRFPASGKFAGPAIQPALGSDGTVYLPVNSLNTWTATPKNPFAKLYALAEDGVEKWNVDPGESGVDFGAPSIGTDGTIYIGTIDGKAGDLRAYGPDRTHKWTMDIAHAISSGPAIGANGQLIATSSVCQVVASFDAAGRTGKRSAFAGSCRGSSAPIIGSDGFGYFTVMNSTRLFRSATSDASTTEVAATSLWTPQHAAVASSGGYLYLVTGNKEILAVDVAYGRKRWTSPALGAAPGPPLLAADGTLFVMADKLYAIPTSNGGPAELWPMIGKDVGRSGNAAVASAEPHNQAPEVRITSPSIGEAFYAEQSVTLSADASDPEDGNLDTALRWSSDVDGHLGDGAHVSKALTPGQHLITATAEDKDGRSGHASISITVKSRPKRATKVTLTPSISGYKVTQGRVVSFVAAASGGSGAYEYKYVLHNATGQRIAQNWSPTATFDWNTSDYLNWQLVVVYARSVGQLEAAAHRVNYFQIYPAGAATAVTLAVHPGEEVDAGTPIKFTGSVPDLGTFEYQFSLYPLKAGGAWVSARDWSTDPTFTLDTSSISGRYYMKVSARGVGVSQYAVQAYAIFTVNMVGAAESVVLRSNPTGGRVSEGDIVSFEASASGGKGEYEYQFHVGGWAADSTTLVRDWAASPHWDWDTAGIHDGGYHYVWVSARAKGIPQTPATAYRGFRITPNTEATGVTLEATPGTRRVHAGTKVRYVAQGQGGTGTYEYRFSYSSAPTHSQVMAQDWSSNNVFTFDTAGRTEWHYVQVSTRCKGNGSVITGGKQLEVVAPGSPLTISVESSLPSPQPAGTVITFSASSTGAAGEVEYRWVQRTAGVASEGKVVQDWSAKTSWTWTPTATEKGFSWLRVYARTKGTTGPGIEAFLYYILEG